MMKIVPYHKKNTSAYIRMVAVTALLSALSFILAFIEIPVVLSPAFAKMDLSDFPALIGTFVFGPVCGLVVELIKNALQLLSTTTGGIGELANFIMGASYVLTAGWIYKSYKSKKAAWTACIAASLVMGVVAAVVNYFILFSLFEQFMPLEQLIASFHSFIPFIQTRLDIVLYNVLPFNILKGLVLGAFTMPIYKKLNPAHIGTR